MIEPRWNRWGKPGTGGTFSVNGGGERQGEAPQPDSLSKELMPRRTLLAAVGGPGRGRPRPRSSGTGAGGTPGSP